MTGIASRIHVWRTPGPATDEVDDRGDRGCMFHPVAIVGWTDQTQVEYLQRGHAPQVGHAESPLRMSLCCTTGGQDQACQSA